MLRMDDMVFHVDRYIDSLSCSHAGTCMPYPTVGCAYDALHTTQLRRCMRPAPLLRTACFISLAIRILQLVDSNQP